MIDILAYRTMMYRKCLEVADEYMRCDKLCQGSILCLGDFKHFYCVKSSNCFTLCDGKELEKGNMLSVTYFYAVNSTKRRD